jgi:surfactin synthase thioesterase subunit
VSHNILKDQARYVSKAIKYIMNKFHPEESSKFSIITHSMGGLIAYMATQ